MKTRILALALSMIGGVLLLAGCSNEKENITSETQESTEGITQIVSSEQSLDDSIEQNLTASTQSAALNSGTDTTDLVESDNFSDKTDPLEAIGEVEVDKSLFNVTLNIPKDYVGDITQEKLDVSVKTKGYKLATLNSDGSVTYVMTKAQHKELMEEISQTIIQALSDMVGPLDYPDITDISANDDFTYFKITTTNSTPNLKESMSVLSMYMYGGMYGVFNGKKADNIHVDFINATSGEVISSADSKNMRGSE